MKQKLFTKYILCAFILSCCCLGLFPLSASHAKEKAAPAPAPPTIISAEVVNALARGDLQLGADSLRDHPTSAKSMYLLRQIARIMLYDNEEKPNPKNTHQYYKNVAIAYHNLFLFLKAQGRENDEFFKKALKFYKKSNSSSLAKQKQENAILTAALYAAKGDEEKAAKLFEKANKDKFGLDYSLQVAWATYHAAMGHTDETITALRAAYKESPESIMTWLRVGDDFFKIREQASFIQLLHQWHVSQKEKDEKFSLPKSSPPKLKYSTPPVKRRRAKRR